MQWFWFWMQLLPIVLGPVENPHNDLAGEIKNSAILVDIVQPEQPEIPSIDDLRRQRIEECLAIYFTKPIDASSLRPWSLMHGLIGYGLDAEVYFDGRPINAVSYLCSNGAGDKLRLLELANGQHLRTRQGPGVQGHPGQFLAILAQAGASIDQPLLVDGKSFTVRDLIAYEQKQCRVRTELTFMLIAFSHYLEPQATWVNQQGEKWNMAKLVREELNQPIYSGACGGTHRLMGLGHAVKQMERHGHPLSGEWLQAARVLEIHQQHAWKYQNADGGFSTEFFQGPGNDRDWTQQLYATGHILEWLAFVMSPEQLAEERVSAAVDHLLDLMLNAPQYELDVGPRGHGLHALRLYEEKVYGGQSNVRELVEAGAEYRPAKTAQPLKHLKLKVELTQRLTVEQAPAAQPKATGARAAEKTPARPAGFRGARRR